MNFDAEHSRLRLEWRLPRIVTACLVGALLGLSGAIFQGVFRNSLAEPYRLGASGGAALGATIAFAVGQQLPLLLSLEPPEGLRGERPANARRRRGPRGATGPAGATFSGRLPVRSGAIDAPGQPLLSRFCDTTCPGADTT